MSGFFPFGSDALGGPGQTTIKLFADPGAFVSSGNDAALFDPTPQAWGGAVYVTGSDAIPAKRKTLDAATGAISLSPGDGYLNATKFIDRYWDDTVLLLHADDFTDTKKNSVTKIGAPSIDTSIKKFGTGSISMPSSDGNYIRAADSDNWRFRTSPFTMEGWYRFTTYRDGAVLMAQWYYGFAFWFADGNQLYLRTWNGDTAKYYFVPQNNRWYHFAVDRDANSVVRIYIDGVMVSKTLNFTSDINGSGYPLSIGTLEPTFYGYFFTGNYDEIRITKGVARYASDSGFTLQTLPFGTGLMTADAGSVSMTGGEATFTRSSPMLLARTANFYLFGRAANLSSAGYFSGSFSLGGGDAALIHRIPTKLSAAPGDFSIGSSDVYLRRGWVWKLKVNHFLLSGGNAVMQRPLRNITAETGSWDIEPQTAGMRHKWLLRLSGTSYALDGYPSTYWRSRRLTAASGAFSLALNPAMLRTSWRTPVEPARLVLDGQPISAYWRGRLKAATGDYLSTGYLTSMRQSHRLDAASADYTLTGLDALPLKVNSLFSERGVFALSGIPAKKQILRKGRPTRYLLVGNGAIIWSGWGGDATGEVTSAAAVASVSSGQAQGWVSAPRAQGAWSDQ